MLKIIPIIIATLSTPLYADRSTDFMDKQRSINGGYRGTAQYGGERTPYIYNSYRSNATLERRVALLEERLEQLRPIIKELRAASRHNASLK